MRRLKLCLAAACLLAVGCYSVRRPEAPAGPHVSVLTYNVNYHLPEPEKTLKAIQDSGADVVCLQETNPEWEGLLTARLTAIYPHVAFRYPGGGGGQAFLSKWPFEEVAYVRPATGWFPGWIAKVQTPIGPVQLLNVHLHPPVSKRGDVGLHAYVATSGVRRQEAEEFYARLEPNLPTIILGDFNQMDNGSSVRWLKEQGMTDALREFDRHSRTWQWPPASLLVHARLDHILFSKDLACVGARVLLEGGSDHYPVIATFQAAKDH